MGGICPGPAVLTFYFYIPQTIVFIVILICGQLFENAIDKKFWNLLNGVHEKKEKKMKLIKKKEPINNDDLTAQVKINNIKVYNNNNNNNSMAISEIREIKV